MEEQRINDLHIATGSIHRLFNVLLEKRFREKGIHLTSEQWSILQLLSETKPISQSDIAKKLFKNRGTISTMVSLMEKERLVSRNQQPGKKGNSLLLTNLGKHIQNQVFEEEKEIYKTIDTYIPKEQLYMFKAVSNHLIDILMYEKSL